MQTYSNVNTAAQKKTIKSKETDKLFLMLDEARDGQLSWKELNRSYIDKKTCKLYLARELQFLSQVGSVAGLQTLSELLSELHSSMLRNG
jgi:hypothetical protein